MGCRLIKFAQWPQELLTLGSLDGLHAAVRLPISGVRDAVEIYVCHTYPSSKCSYSRDPDPMSHYCMHINAIESHRSTQRHEQQQQPLLLCGQSHCTLVVPQSCGRCSLLRECQEPPRSALQESDSSRGICGWTVHEA